MRRTPMPARRTPLRNTKALARKTPLRAVSAGTQARSRARRTNPPPAVSPTVRALLLERAGGRCEVCGAPTLVTGVNVHHRQPRGAGGSKTPSVNEPPNLLHLCPPCHGLVESQRALAYTHGWLVKRPTDPACVPVLLWDGRTVFLTPDGTYQEAPR